MDIIEFIAKIVGYGCLAIVSIFIITCLLTIIWSITSGDGLDFDEIYDDKDS